MMRRRVAALALLAALVVAAAWNGKTLYWWATTKSVYTLNGGIAEPIHVVEHIRYSRWDENWTPPIELWDEAWYSDTGYLAYQRPKIGKDHWMLTLWMVDGAVQMQLDLDKKVASLGRRITSPPWRMGVTDQSRPTAPWSLAGISFDEWWAALPDEMKKVR